LVDGSRYLPPMVSSVCCCAALTTGEPVSERLRTTSIAVIWSAVNGATVSHGYG